jgi:hypothetical protein
VLGQAHPVTVSHHLAACHELIDDRAHRVVAEKEAAGASMTAGPRIARLRTHARNERIDADVGGQRLAVVDPSQHREQATLGQSALGGVDRPHE